MEIERKFLMKELAGPERQGGHRIEQGYVVISADGTEVRLRRKGDRFFETIKRGVGMVRSEIEIELTPEQFATLWPATEELRIVKTRYEIEWQGREIEIDVYSGRLAGLCTAEVEFPSAEEATGFVPPPWCGVEVTDDHGYKNQSLAIQGIPAAGSNMR